MTNTPLPKKLKILYVLPSFTLGGTETHLLRLMAGLKKKGYHMSVYFRHEDFDIINRIDEMEIPYSVLGMKSIFDIKGFVRLVRALKKEKPDIVHAYLFEPSLYGPLAARLAGVKAVFTSRRNYDDWMRWHHIAMQKIANFFTDKIFVNSQCVKKLVMQQEGVKDEKVLNIYNSIEKDKFYKSSREQNTIKKQTGMQLGIQDNDMVVLMLAKFKESKGHEFLLEAAKKVCRDLPNVKFLLVGKGPLQHSMEQKAKELGISGKVIFAGETYAPAGMISMSDVCVLSSIREGFSNALMEYMAAAKAVVVTDVGGNRELIRNGENGLLVKKEDAEALSEAIKGLLKDKAKREEFGRKALERISDIEFEPEYETESFNAVYRETLNVATGREKIFALLKRKAKKIPEYILSKIHSKTLPLKKMNPLEEPKDILPAPRSAENPKKGSLNFIIFSIDPLRSDHMSLYGYRRNTTPNIDNFAKKCAVFKRAYSQAPWTTPSHMSLFTSLYPSFHGVDQPMRDTMRRLGSDKKTLAECLKENGYRTGAFTGSGSIAGKWGFSRGFDVYEETASEDVSPRGRDIDMIYSKASRWLEKNKHDKFFLFFHTYNTHAPYRDEYFARKEKISRFRKVEYLKALYDGDIRVTDKVVGDFLRMLEKENLLKNTAIILLSDHGEDFGEHYPFKMTRGHGHSLYEDLLRVPLLIKHPALTKTRAEINEKVRLIDVMPTVLDMAGLPLPGGIQGRSLLGFLKGASVAMPKYFFAESICHGPERKMVSNGKYKYIYTPQPDVQKTERKIYPVFMHELYDIEADPEETANLYHRAEKGISRALHKELGEFIEKGQQSNTKDSNEFQVDETLKKRLKALGYIE